MSRGNWLEVPDGAAVKTNDGVWLCPVMNGARFYDSSAQAQRMLCSDKGEATVLETNLLQAAKARDKELEEILARELMGQRKPRNKKKRAADLPLTQELSAEA